MNPTIREKTGSLLRQDLRDDCLPHVAISESICKKMSNWLWTWRLKGVENSAHTPCVMMVRNMIQTAAIVCGISCFQKRVVVLTRVVYKIPEGFFSFPNYFKNLSSNSFNHAPTCNYLKQMTFMFCSLACKTDSFLFNKLKTNSFVANVLSKPHKIDNLSFH